MHSQKLKNIFKKFKSFKMPPKEIRKAWISAARPQYYIATLAPLFIAFILAGKDTGEWNYLYFFGILLACFLLHLAANLSNDYYDYFSGVDNADTIGGSGSLRKGAISLEQYRTALKSLYGAAVVIAFLGAALTGLWQILLIVAFAIFASHYYVAPPLRFGYRGMGEVLVFISMGLVMTCGTYFTLTGKVSGQIFALSIVIGLMVAGILYFQSLPEIISDKEGGKHTLANCLGPKKAKTLFQLWWPGVWLLVFLLWITGASTAYALLGVLISIPFHLLACQKVDKAYTTGDWFGLDKHGKLVRLMYFFCAFFLIIGVAKL